MENRQTPRKRVVTRSESDHVSLRLWITMCFTVHDPAGLRRAAPDR